LSRFYLSKMTFNVISTPRCAVLSDGVFGHCGKKLMACFMSAPPYQRNLKKLIEKDLAALREEDRLTPDLVFRDPYFLDFLGLKDTFSEKTLKRPSSGKWRALFWSLESVFRLLPAKKGSLSIMKIIILICSFFTASSNGSLPLN